MEAGSSPMKAHEIESVARDIIDRVKAGQRVEDYLYELKADWPADYASAAARIGGLGNAARGEPFLWLIGVDETRGVTGASAVDMARWYPQVERHFDGHAPGVKSKNFSVDGLAVVALFFESDGRAPFVVKNPKGGYPEFSVPWREGTRLRAARRDELLRILSPLQRVPDLEIVGAVLEIDRPDGTRSQIWKAALKVFVTPKDAHHIIIPFHRCKGEVMFPNQNFQHSFAQIKVQPYSRNAETITATDTEAVIKAPGTFALTGEFTISDIGGKPGGDAHVTSDLYLASMDQWSVILESVPICMLNYDRWERGEKVELEDAFFFG